MYGRNNVMRWELKQVHGRRQVVIDKPYLRMRQNSYANWYRSKMFSVNHNQIFTKVSQIDKLLI